MRNRTVRELMAFCQSKPTIVHLDVHLRDVAEQLIENPATREVYLVDADDRFYGVISVRRLAHFVFTHHVPHEPSTTELLDLVSARSAQDLALKKVVCVTEDDSLESLVSLMFRSEIDEIPVVDARRSIVGKIGMLELIAAWHAGDLDGDDAPAEG